MVRTVRRLLRHSQPCWANNQQPEPRGDLHIGDLQGRDFSGAQPCRAKEGRPRKGSSVVASSGLLSTAAHGIPFGLRESDGNWFHYLDHSQVAKRIRALEGIKEEHEADQRPIDCCRGIAFGEQMVAIGFGIR